MSAFDSHTTRASCQQRQERLLLDINKKLEDVIYKEQVNQLWKVGMESMMHSVWAKVCTHYTTVSVSCQTDEQVEQVCDPSPGKCATCLHGTVICPSEDERGLGFGTEEDSEQNCEGNPVNHSLEWNFSSRVNVSDVENGSSTSADARQEERSEPDSASRSKKTKSYKNAHCTVKFSRKDDFSKHRRAHLNPIEHYKCQRCLRVFKTHGGLMRHTKGHACQRKPGKSIFQCSECAKSFNTRGTFYNHFLSHREKKIVCTICDKAFHFKSQLKEHRTTHTGEKLYRCEVCSKRFSHRNYMYRHVRLQHPT